MDLNDIQVFAKVIQAGSFTAAARELGMPKSTVSRKLSELEGRLGARLLQRTTRKLHLTEVGSTFYQHALRVMAELQDAELAVTNLQATPRGLLRVTTPLNFDYLSPIVSSFLARYPEVELEVACSDRVVPLIEEGFDVAIRAGALADSTLIARSLGSVRSFIVATPAFLKKHGSPKAPEDITKFPCVAFGAGSNRKQWKLQAKGKTISVALAPRLQVNDFDFLYDAAREGLGLALLPAFRCVADLRDGTLKRVLADWCSPPVPLSAVYPSTRHLSPKVKAFLDHLQERLTPPPWEVGSGAKA